MSRGTRGLVIGLLIGAVALGAMVLRGDRGHEVATVGQAAVEAFRDGKFERFRPFTPAGLSPENRLRLMCGDGDIQASCQTRFDKAMKMAAKEEARFRAAFDESVAQAVAAGFDWTDAVLVSVDESGVTATPPRIDSGVAASGRLMVHGRSPAGGGFVLELTGCAKITWQGWLCAIPRWHAEEKTKDVMQ